MVFSKVCIILLFTCIHGRELLNNINPGNYKLEHSAESFATAPLILTPIVCLAAVRPHRQCGNCAGPGAARRRGAPVPRCRRGDLCAGDGRRHAGHVAAQQQAARPGARRTAAPAGDAAHSGECDDFLDPFGDEMRDTPPAVVADIDEFLVLWPYITMGWV